MRNETQNTFLSDLRAQGSTITSMDQLQKKYSHIASKASIKRDITSLLEDGSVDRIITTISTPRGIRSISTYSARYTKEQEDMMESDYYNNLIMSQHIYQES